MTNITLTSISIPLQNVRILLHREFDDKILPHPTMQRCLEEKCQEVSRTKGFRSTTVNIVPFSPCQCDIRSPVEKKEKRQLVKRMA